MVFGSREFCEHWLQWIILSCRVGVINNEGRSDNYILQLKKLRQIVNGCVMQSAPAILQQSTETDKPAQPALI